MNIINLILYDWAGWVLVFFTYYLLFYFRYFISSKILLIILIFVLSLHHGVAFFNAYTDTVIETAGNISDSKGYHQLAVLIATGEKNWLLGLGDKAYINALGFMYKIFGPSRFFGEELSILAFFISCYFLIHLARQIGFTRYESPIILIYGSLPSVLIYSSLIMRESWMTFFFMGSVLYGIKFGKTGKLKFAFVCMVFAILMGVLHRGFFIFGIYLIITVIVWAIYYNLNKILIGSKKYSMKKLIYGAFTIILIGSSVGIYLGPNLLKIPTGNALLAIKDGKGLEYIERYRSTVTANNARSNYGGNIDSSSLTLLFLSSLKIFLLYMFMPLPWHITNIVDLYGTFEAIFRIVFIFSASLSLRKNWGKARSQAVFLLVLYFSMAFLWSLGTVNYGTSIRHHTINIWIIILLGVPGLIKIIKCEDFKNNGEN